MTPSTESDLRVVSIESTGPRWRIVVRWTDRHESYQYGSVDRLSTADLFDHEGALTVAVFDRFHRFLAPVPTGQWIVDDLPRLTAQMHTEAGDVYRKFPESGAGFTDPEVEPAVVEPVSRWWARFAAWVRRTFHGFTWGLDPKI